jgi:hypothetical protein
MSWKTEEPWLDSRQVQGNFLFGYTFTMVVDPAKPLDQWLPVDLRQEREAGHLFPLYVEVNVWSLTSTPIRLHSLPKGKSFFGFRKKATDL